MTDQVSWEDASRCPKCDNPGEDNSVRVQRDGSKLHVVYCRNSRCSWFNTSWVVQVMSDGTIPVRSEGELHRKEYPHIPSAKATAERILEQITREEQIDTPPPT